jgi:putative iron-dependent peroxidase
MVQPRILTPPPPHALLLTLRVPTATALRELAGRIDLQRTILGLGAPLVAAMGAHVPGLTTFEAISGPGVSFPSTQGDLWLALYDGDPGELLHEARRLLDGLDMTVDEAQPTYTHRDGRDLSGYLDGTANPEDVAAVALVDGPPGLEGSSYLHVQRWVHDLDAITRMSAEQRDLMIGRRHADNEELADAPPSAHVKRTEQEAVGFLLRRSMPWGSLDAHGLVFVAYARDPGLFHRHLRRMAGLEDGVTDALLRVSRAVTGGAWWCPPTRRGRLDLRAL